MNQEETEKEIFNERKNKFLKIGRNKGFMSNSEDLSSLRIPKNDFRQMFKSKKILISLIGLMLISLVLFISFL